jgi:hypothetical protein
MVSAAIGTVFVEEPLEAARSHWRIGTAAPTGCAARGLFSTLMDDAVNDVLALHDFPANSLEPSHGVWPRGTGVRPCQAALATAASSTSKVCFSAVKSMCPYASNPPSWLAGRVSAAAGRAAFEAMECGIRMALRGEVSALCTAPIDEEALAAAGVPYPGPTEMLTELSDSADSADTAMMLANPELRTMLVTVHGALAQALTQITLERELRLI